MRPSDDILSRVKEELAPVTDIDVRALSEIYEETDVYLSIYLPKGSREDEAQNDNYMKGRLRAIGNALEGELLRNFNDTVEMVGHHLEADPIAGERGRIIFASASVGLIHVYRVGLVPERTLVLDTSPFLLPLARLRDDYQDYAILLLDSQEARLYSVRSNIVNVEGSGSIDLMGKHKKGGMSQMRFNRLRRGAISSFISELVGDITGFFEGSDLRGMVIAGPGEAKKQLLADLPPELHGAVIGVEDVPMTAPLGDLLAVGEKVVLKDERARERAAMDILKDSIMKARPSAYGAQKVLNALNEGRVNLLLLLRDASIPGWICERCQNIRDRAAPPERCPFCGGPTSGVDVVEELYELAQRTGADVEFVTDSEFLASIGGIAALLRY